MPRQTARAGLKFVWNNITLRRLTLCLAVISFAVAFSQSTLTLYLVTVVKIPERFIGLFTVTLALGGLGAMRAAPFMIGKLGRIKVLPAALGVLAIGIAMMGLTHAVWMGALAATLMAGGATLWNIAAMTARQSLTPDNLLGRVQGVGITVATTAALIGTPLGGLLGRTGLRLPFLVGAAVVLAMGGMLHWAVKEPVQQGHAPARAHPSAA